MKKPTREHDMSKINQITGQILKAALEVHKELGLGFLEAVYEECLAKEFDRKGLSYIRQCNFPVIYKGEKTDKTYRVDFLVENEVPVELKAIDALAIIINYIKMAERKVGILINFNVPRLMEGYRRLIV